MPAAVTHAYFVKDVYKKLKPKVRRKIDLDTLILFSQGPDVFYHTPLIYKKKKEKSFGYIVHSTKTAQFMIEYVDHILKYRLEKRKDIISSCYGMLSHNILDKKTHPLIFYQTNKDRTKHREMELLIDLYMLERRERINPRKVKLSKLLFPKVETSVQLRILLDRVYEDVYGKPNMGKVYLASLKKQQRTFKWARNDSNGYKLKFYQALSKLPFVSKRICYLSYANDLRKKVKYVNFEHEEWCHPCNKNELSTKSFFDLYQEAIEEAVKQIEFIHEVLTQEAELKDLRNVLDNKSMITGKDCNSKSKMRYFKNQTEKSKQF